MSEIDTGLFSFSDDDLALETVGWATCQVDLLGQGIAQFHLILPDGYGTSTYGWHSNFYLRGDRIRQQAEYVIEQDGEWSIEDEWKFDDDLCLSIHETAFEEDPIAMLALLLQAAAPRLNIRPITDNDLEQVDSIDFVDEPEVIKALQERGREQRLTAPAE